MKWTRILLWVILALACVGIAILLPRTLSTYQTLETERNATPTPTANIASMLDVTIDPNNTPTPTAMVLKRGMESDDVTTLQQALKDLGYYDGVVDGQFGDGTAEAVKLFQSQAGLDADGLAGEATLTLLYSGSAQTYVATPTPSPTPSVIKKGETPTVCAPFSSALRSWDITPERSTGSLAAARKKPYACSSVRTIWTWTA